MPKEYTTNNYNKKENYKLVSYNIILTNNGLIEINQNLVVTYGHICVHEYWRPTQQFYRFLFELKKMFE